MLPQLPARAQVARRRSTRMVGRLLTVNRARQADTEIRVGILGAVADALLDDRNRKVASLGQAIHLGRCVGCWHLVACQVRAVGRCTGLLTPGARKRPRVERVESGVLDEAHSNLAVLVSVGCDGNGDAPWGT